MTQGQGTQQNHHPNYNGRGKMTQNQYNSRQNQPNQQFAEQRLQPRPCHYYYQQGWCRYGEGCWYSHDVWVLNHKATRWCSPAVASANLKLWSGRCNSNFCATNVESSLLAVMWDFSHMDLFLSFLVSRSCISSSAIFCTVTISYISQTWVSNSFVDTWFIRMNWFMLLHWNNDLNPWPTGILLEMHLLASTMFGGNYNRERICKNSQAHLFDEAPNINGYMDKGIKMWVRIKNHKYGLVWLHLYLLQSIYIGVEN